LTAKFLLDTNVLSEPLKPLPSKKLLSKLAAHEGQCVTAAPVWHELVYGAALLPNSRRKALLEAYLSDVVKTTLPILAYDELAATWHAEQRARLSTRGQTPAFVDGQIASIAAIHGLVLVTANTQDFRRFKIPIQDWT
jgi:tRNA(fMet)-specific endonuclease VapC